MEEMTEKQVRKIVIEYYKEFLKNVRPKEDYDQLADYILGEGNNTRLFHRLTKFRVLDERAKILDVGCGFGSFMLYLRSKGIPSFGVEPEDFQRSIAQKRLSAIENRNVKSAIFGGVGEALPFKDITFDIVILKEILEHVSDPQKCLDEALRVLKASGLMYIASPNYMWIFKEPHYKVPWIPLLPRRIARLYLKGLGRDVSYFDSINQITSYKVLKALRRGDAVIISPSYLDVQRKIDNPTLIKGSRERKIVYFFDKISLTPLLKYMVKSTFFLRKFVFSRSFVVLVTRRSK